MINLNDSMYDDAPYSTRNFNRNHPWYILSDQLLINKLQAYEDFKTELINNIITKKPFVYLRFCDWEYIYYNKKNLIYYVKKIIKKILMRENKTSWWESMDNNLQEQHYNFFKEHANKIKFCPMFSDSWIKSFQSSYLYDIVLQQEKIWHLYYVYHFLNSLRQHKIPELIEIKIAYVTHNKYINEYDHYKIWMSYSEEWIQMLKNTDFSKYDLVLLWWWISSPLYSKAILTSCDCPIIDSWYMLSIRNSNNEFNEGPYTHLFT